MRIQRGLTPNQAIKKWPTNDRAPDQVYVLNSLANLSGASRPMTSHRKYHRELSCTDVGPVDHQRIGDAVCPETLAEDTPDSGGLPEYTPTELEKQPGSSDSGHPETSNYSAMRPTQPEPICACSWHCRLITRRGPQHICSTPDCDRKICSVCVTKRPSCPKCHAAWRLM